ncbi:MAG TPA: FtsX-like permease family protein, partial [Acidimicrobiales bacterium]|nr:FtsX-like permease family protein [Acidimicrobiales bacterium]
DPRRDDEVTVNRAAASRYDLKVGQRVTIVSATDLQAFFGGPVEGGPSVPATIVGIGDGAMDELFFPGEPGFFPSGGFLLSHPEVPRAPNLVVRLRPGADVNAFHTKVAGALGLPDVPVRDLAEDRKRITHGTDLERTGLLLFSAAVLVAGLFLAGQALTRTVYGMADSVPTLRAMGLTNPGLVAGMVLPLLVAAVTAAAVAVGAAVALSNRFPVGLARRLDPDLGLHADWLVLAPGAAVVAALVVGGAALAARRATRASRADRRPERRSAVVRAIRGAAPLPVGIGAGYALEVGRAERSLPVRPALAGTMAGVLGVLGALGLVRGIDDALARPERSGQVWDAALYPSDDRSAESMVTALQRDRDVDQIAYMHRVPFDVQGAGLPVYAVEPVRGDLSFVVLDGRAPRGRDEAAIGPASAKALGKGIGDSVQVGEESGRSLRIVGISLLSQEAHSSFDQGVWTTPDTLQELTEAAGTEPEWGPTILVTARAGIPPTQLLDNLERRLDVADAGIRSLPQDVLQLRNVRSLPQAFAAFLVLLGLAALGHALVTAVRRRRHDLAVLRAMGFRPGQNAAVIFWQAMTVVVVALAVGIPLGVAAGRLSWQWVADATPLLYVPPLAAAALVMAVPAAVVLANLLAAVPALRAARLQPARVLRSE